MRSQQVNVVIDPMFFAGMVSQARKIVQESEGRAQGLEQLAQDVYKQDEASRANPPKSNVDGTDGTS